MKSESGSRSDSPDQFQPTIIMPEQSATRTITLPHSWPDLPDGMRLVVRYHDLGFSLQPDTDHDKLVSALRDAEMIARGNTCPFGEALIRADDKPPSCRCNYHDAANNIRAILAELEDK